MEKRFSLVEDFYSLDSEELQLSCEPDKKVQDISPLLVEPKQSSLGVVDNDRNLIGIIT